MDIKDIKKLIDIAAKFDLAELEYSEGEKKIRIVRGLNPHIQLPIPQGYIPQTTSPQQLTGNIPSSEQIPLDKSGDVSSKMEKTEQITSPMVGTFYRASAPDSDPFVEEGDIVEPGQTICIIEAMKLMNEIKAENKCKIINILTENGHPVEFGQPLFKIEKL